MENEILTQEQRERIHDMRNELGKCPGCNSNIKDRTIEITEELVEAVRRVYRYCGAHQCHEFKMRDVSTLFTKTQYCRFGDMVRCSNGIIYRPDDPDEPEAKHLRRGAYGMHMARAREFFNGEREMHLQILVDQITGKRVAVLKEAKIGEFPALKELLTADGFYEPNKLL